MQYSLVQFLGLRWYISAHLSHDPVLWKPLYGDPLHLHVLLCTDPQPHHHVEHLLYTVHVLL